MQHSLRTFLMTLAVVLALPSCKKKQLPVQQATQGLPEFFDATPTEKPASYIYSPGLMGTEAAMGRFCPTFTAVTGEKISWRSGIHVIGQPHSAVIFAEIDLRKPNHFTLSPITAIVNSLRQDLGDLAKRMMQDSLNCTIEENHDCHLSVAHYGLRLHKANIGQKKDIALLHNTYMHHREKHPHHDIILYGDSRGAATTFNFIALHNPPHVKAAVMEGIFDSVPHIIKHFLYTDKKPHEEKRLHSIAKFVFGAYKEHGTCPRILVEQIQDDIPLLLITSLQDELTSAQCAFYLYERLRARGHQKVHLLVLKKSKHPSYAVADKEDQVLYETTVHAFYKQYNLPHNSALAARGEQHFGATQPTAEYLRTTYNLPRCPLCNA